MNAGYLVKELPGERQRMYNALARFGYTPQTALADIIDNSLSADATLVNIDVSEQADGTWKVYIADNGSGMSPEVLEKAIAFGSPKEIQKSDLSKFGFGMKTASLAVSPSGFSVVTRGGNAPELSAISLRKEHQQGTGSPLFALWQTEAIDPTWIKYLDKTAGAGGRGTLIVWEKADLRAADLYKKGGRGGDDKTRKRIENRISKYLGQVFHRWIDGENAAPRQVVIKFKGEAIEGWNPLAAEWLDESQVAEIAPLDIENSDGEVVNVALKVWVARKDIPKKIAEEVVRKNTAEQGIYLYRMNRIINTPSWFGIIPGARSPLNGLRFSIDVDPKLDDEIHLDVKKAQSDLPDALMAYIRPHVEYYMRSEEVRASLAKREGNKQKTPVEALESAAKKFQELERFAPTVRPERQSSTEVITTNQDGEKLLLHMKELPQNMSGSQQIHRVSSSETSGYLWEPRTDNQLKLQLLVNEDHDFYQKVMLPASKEAFEGFVALLMAFSKAELASQYSQFKLQFQHMRRHMSETLEAYCEDIEMPDLTGTDE